MLTKGRTALSVIVGILVIALLAILFRFNLIVAVLCGFVAFLGMSYFLSSTPQEAADTVVKLDTQNAIRLAQQQIKTADTLSHHLQLPAKVKQQLSQIVGFARGILRDMKDPRRASLAKLQEMSSYLGDLNEAVRSYIGIADESIVIPRGSNKAALLRPLEQELPQYVSGFHALAASADADDAALIGMKTATLRQKMLVRGRLENDQE